MSVVGARPQFIKLAAMHKAIQKDGTLRHIIVHSGQHYNFDMSGQFFEELQIPKPDYNLEIGSGHHVFQMAKCMTGLVDVFEKEKPDMVLVYGDTNTTAAAAITAAKCNLKLAHIEAGLREWDKTIPEEVNKLLTDAVADLYFTPTVTGRDNLLREGKSHNVFVTGDIGLDLLTGDTEDGKDLPSKEYIFVTCHRASNTENPENLKAILSSLAEVDKDVVFPLHPRTKNAIEKFGLWHHLTSGNIHVTEPLGFWDTQQWIRNAWRVVTDSGGVIKEAYFYKVPCIITDKQTEWVESVNEGWSIVAGPYKDQIIKAARDFEIPKKHSNFLGDGQAGVRIVAKILEYLYTRN